MLDIRITAGNDPCQLSFFFHHTAPNQIYTLSLHDALPISPHRGRNRSGYRRRAAQASVPQSRPRSCGTEACAARRRRSEEHTSELQSLTNLVCRLLLEKKKKRAATTPLTIILIIKIVMFSL